MDRNVLVGGGVAAAVAVAAVSLIIFILVRRQWSHSEERKLRLRAQLSGLAFDDDQVDTIFVVPRTHGRPSVERRQ